MVSLVFTSRVGPRRMTVAAGLIAVVGMATVVGAPAAWVLGAAIFAAGMSTGLASPPMAEAVGHGVSEHRQDRSNAVINSGASVSVAGSAYVMLTGIILVWSVAMFADRPSTGLKAGFLVIAVGQVVGSPVAGALAGATSLPMAFFVFAGLSVLLAISSTRHVPRSSTIDRFDGE